MSSIAPPEDAEGFMDSRASSAASDRPFTPQELIVEENYEIFRPRSRAPTPFTPQIQAIRPSFSRKSRSADGVRRNEHNKSLISSIFPSSSEIAWETTSHNSYKNPIIMGRENDMQFVAQVIIVRLGLLSGSITQVKL